MTYDWVCRNSAMIRVISMLWVVVFLLFLFFYFLFIIFVLLVLFFFFFFFQAEDGIRDRTVTGVQTCALPIWPRLSPCYRPNRVCPSGGSSRTRRRRTSDCFACCRGRPIVRDIHAPCRIADRKSVV